MPQIGQLAFAVFDREQPLGQIRFGGDLFEDGGEPRANEEPGRLPQLSGDTADQIRTCAIDFASSHAEQRSAGGEADTVGAMRLFERAQQPEPVRRTGGGEDAGATGEYGSDADAVQSVSHHVDLGSGSHQYRDIAGSDRTWSGLRLEQHIGFEQPHDIRREILGDLGSHTPDRWESRFVQRARAGARQTPHPQRPRLVPAAGQP